MAQWDELEGPLGQITSLLEGLCFVVNREKPHLRPTQSIQFLGFLVNSQEMSIKLTEEKVAQIATACRRVREAGSLSVRQQARLIGNDSNHTGSISCTSVVPGAAASEESGATDIPVIRGNSGDEPGGILRVGMLVDQNESVEWEANPTTGTRLSHRDRCLNAWLGSSLQQCENCWSLVTDRE